jgi:hypothetical protein
MVLFAFAVALGLTVMSMVLLGVPVLRLAKQALPIVAPPAPRPNDGEIDDAPTEQTVEELTRAKS